MWARSDLLDLLGIEHPIIQAPMAGSATPALAAAVGIADVDALARKRLKPFYEELGLGEVPAGALDRELPAGRRSRPGSSRPSRCWARSDGAIGFGGHLSGDLPPPW